MLFRSRNALAEQPRRRFVHGFTLICARMLGLATPHIRRAILSCSKNPAAIARGELFKELTMKTQDPGTYQREPVYETPSELLRESIPRVACELNEQAIIDVVDIGLPRPVFQLRHYSHIGPAVTAFPPVGE